MLQSPPVNRPRVFPPAPKSDFPDPEYPKTGTKEEVAAFFEGYKKQLASPAEYVKFLKLFTIYKKGLLERYTLVEHVKFRVGRNKQLSNQFCDWWEIEGEECGRGKVQTAEVKDAESGNSKKN
jgi:histone deacetylase complex regulatory component SIN3